MAEISKAVKNPSEFTSDYLISHAQIALLASHQFSLGLSHLCCFRENITELSQDLQQLPCEYASWESSSCFDFGIARPVCDTRAYSDIANNKLCRV
ncbi:hypothetical protein T09_10745 [Trichinella sp. T9]|nr:hypothetical protein T09_10745 [Trichinella sp. T9]